MWRCGEGKTEREGDIRPCMDRGGEPLCTVFWEVIQHIFQISSPHQSSWCACSGAKTAPQPYNNRNGGACFTALRAGANTHNSPLHTPHHSQQPQPTYYTITCAMTWWPGARSRLKPNECVYVQLFLFLPLLQMRCLETGRVQRAVVKNTRTAYSGTSPFQNVLTGFQNTV